MKFSSKLLILIICLCFVSKGNLFAQLYGLYPDTVIKANYIEVKDSIYIYGAKKNNYSSVFGTLASKSVNKANDLTLVLSKLDYTDTLYKPYDSIVKDKNTGITYYWKFDTISSKFKPYKTTPLISDIDFFDSIPNGGYQLRMFGNKIDTTFRAWIFINLLHFKLIKGLKGEVKVGDYGCFGSNNFLDLEIIPSNETRLPAATNKYIISSFNYFNPITKKKKTLEPDPVISWYSRIKPYTSDFKFISYTSNQIRVSNPVSIHFLNPPADTTQYMLKINSFNNSLTDTIIYNTIHTKADFEFVVDTNGIDKPAIYSKTDTAGEAPLRVRFFNSKTKNGHQFKWLLVDSIAVVNKDHDYYPDSGAYVKADSTGFQNFTYTLPKIYHPRLISISKEGCIDTSSIKAHPVNVFKSYLPSKDNDVKSIFNKAFSPDEPNIDLKYFYYRKSATVDNKLTSIANLHIEIFNQQGYRVYEYNRDVAGGDWKGWDGTVNATSRKAPAGVYFYYFKATGYGPITVGTRIYKPGESVEGNGFVYLFRK